jgi:hypothetical protein
LAQQTDEFGEEKWASPEFGLLTVAGFLQYFEEFSSVEGILVYLFFSTPSNSIFCSEMPTPVLDGLALGN